MIEEEEEERIVWVEVGMTEEEEEEGIGGIGSAGKVRGSSDAFAVRIAPWRWLSAQIHQAEES